MKIRRNPVISFTFHDPKIFDKYFCFTGKGLNGHSVNGTHEPVVKITAAAANPTTIKCLDDPNFSFDEAPIGGGAANNNKEESNAVPSSQQPTAAEVNEMLKQFLIL